VGGLRTTRLRVVSLFILHLPPIFKTRIYEMGFMRSDRGHHLP
jgi:hypothetical protein